MIGYPFDSQVTYDEFGNPTYDRAISSLPLRQLIHKLFSNGVMPNPSTNLQVIQGDGMNVIVKSGFAIVNGCMKLEEADRTLAVQASSTSYDRIDTVVLRLNDTQEVRMLDLAIHEGTPSSNPIRPDLTRTGSIYEIGLADLYIAKNTSMISPARITDTRYESERCGIISSVSEFDTTTIYNQIMATLDEEKAEFEEWFANLHYILDGDVAGHLQNEIDINKSNIEANSTEIEETNKKFDKLIKYVRANSASQNIGANSYISASADIEIPNGYTVFSVTCTNSNTNNVNATLKPYIISGNTLTLNALLYNMSNAQRSAGARWYVAFVKSEFIEDLTP